MLAKRMSNLWNVIANALFGPPALCGECFATFRERARHPCPRCNSLARIVMRSSVERIAVKDRTTVVRSPR